MEVTPNETPSKPVVMVDDNPGDRMLIEICLEQSVLRNPWLSFETGSAFLQHLDSVKAGEAAMPAVVFLDVNMPEMNGFDVLQATRSQPDFDVLPIFLMLTSSTDPKDRNRALELGAAGVVNKPNVVDEFVEFLNRLGG